MGAGRRRLGRLALVAATLVLAFLSSEATSASSRICRQLEAELASGPGGGRSTAQARKQDAAIARQREQLQLARRQSRSAGCGFRLFGGKTSSCGAISLKIEKMERNLEALQRQRSRTIDAGSGRSQSRIMAARQANGCRDEAVAERRLPRGLDGTRNLLDQIFGGGIIRRGSNEELGPPAYRWDEDRHVRRLPDAGGWVNDDGHIRYSAPPGSYRTLCVRTCDGYYFPMSSASSPSEFERDQMNCQSSCPGTEVQIYYHRTGLESEDMVSGLSGAPYSELPTAYLYKQNDVPSPAGCTCSALKKNEARNFSIVAGNPPAPSEPVAPYPSTQPSADPETLTNVDGGLDVTPKVNKSRPAGEDKKVRVVGPVFLPAPEAAADPQAPDQTPVR